MTIRRIHESGRAVEASADKGTFLIRILDEGEGSSGVYTRELLENSGTKAFRKGTKMFLNHPKDPNSPWERDLTTLAGKLVSDPYTEERDGVVGLYAEAKADSRWKEFLTEYANEIGVSIYVAAEGREEDGKYIVESFDEDDPYASIDWVIAPGRNGGVDRVLESYRAIESSLSDEGGKGTVAEQPQLTENKNEGESSMELKDIQELVEAALAEALSPVLEALKPAETPEDEVDMAAVVEAAVEAELPKESREAVVESVRAGAKAEEAIAKQVALVKAIESSFESKSERVVEGVAVAGSAPKFSLSALGGK